MMTIRRILFFVIGALLVIAPALVRTMLLGYNDRPYAPAEVPTISVAVTPVPTTVAVAAVPDQVRSIENMRPGPVIVDLAHGNRLSRSQFEPLAGALAQRGIGMRFWISDIDVLALDSFLDYPDQSEDLSPLLENASALVVVSPFFLWSDQEIRLVERFVADGGRLLLISDPDVLGDLAQDINVLAEPFGIVFHDDYLYDTSQNDGNYVYVFQGQFLDEAANLTDQEIVFYGSRSISGDMSPLIQTRDSVLSSVRTGITELTTVATGGVEARGVPEGSPSRVLSMGDFDVLTPPFLDRHDNAEMVDFVASFLAAAQRIDTVTDFPAYLGREVALVFGHADAVDATVLEEGAKVQQSLEETGRTLSLAGASMLSASLAGETETDLIVLADYETADETDNGEGTLLRDLGFQLVEVTATPAPTTETTPTATVTPTSSASATPTPTPTAGATATSETATATETSESTDTTSTDTRDTDTDEDVDAEPEATSAPVTETVAPTATPTATPTPTFTPTPEVIVYLETDEGLRLLARETVLIVQQELGLGHRLVAVLGDGSEGIRAGVERLLMDDYEGCVTDVALAVCSFADATTEETRTGAEATATPSPPATAEATPDGEATPARTPTPENQVDGSILLIDDNEGAAEDEETEAEVYLQTLTATGYQPTLWTITTDGTPPTEMILDHTWVIWSSGGYEAGGPNLNQLDALLNYINNGGHLTISSRRPFFGMSPEEPTVIADVEIADGLPALVQGLPEGPVELPNGLPPVVPLETSEEGDGPQIALRRGPNSGNPGAPLLFLATDENEEDPVGAQLMILGMSLTWLPDDYRSQLVENMAGVMMAEP